MENVSATEQQTSMEKRCRNQKTKNKRKRTVQWVKNFIRIHSMFPLHLYVVFSRLFISIENNIGFPFVLGCDVRQTKIFILPVHEWREIRERSNEGMTKTSSTCIACLNASTTRYFRICWYYPHVVIFFFKYYYSLINMYLSKS